MKRIREAQVIEGLDRIGPDHDPGAYLTQAVCPLNDMGFEARPLEGQGGR